MWWRLEQKEVGAAMRVSGGRVSRQGEEDKQGTKLSAASRPGHQEPRDKGEAVGGEVWEGTEATRSSLPK